METAAIVSIIGATVTVIGVIASAIISRNSKRKDMTPLSWGEVYERMDKQDRLIRALINILFEMSAQWPAEAAPPKLNADDVEELGDTIPPLLRPLIRRRVKTHRQATPEPG